MFFFFFLKKKKKNIVGKGENAGNQHFLLFPQCFLSSDRLVAVMNYQQFSSQILLRWTFSFLIKCESKNYTVMSFFFYSSRRLIRNHVFFFCLQKEKFMTDPRISSSKLNTIQLFSKSNICDQYLSEIIMSVANLCVIFSLDKSFYQRFLARFSVYLKTCVVQW